MKLRRLNKRPVPERRGGKLRIGVIFGGRSAEHEVSLVSASSIIGSLDPKKYQIVQIGITKEGVWYSGSGLIDRMKKGGGLDFAERCYISPSRRSAKKSSARRAQTPFTSDDLDVVFPVIHGKLGEDGSLQGLLEFSGIPYVGAGVLGSAAGMDKVVTKQLCEMAGIPVPGYLWFLEEEYDESPDLIISKIERIIKYPCFIKPANSGSSIGISKAKNRSALKRGIDSALRHDRKILIEKSVEGAMEIEVSVLGNDKQVVSVPGEIISSNEFYDYDAKYVDGRSKPVIPADLPRAVIKQISRYSREGFKAIDCSGMARVDFLVTRKRHKIYLNEINTIPGFTSISMYPKLWEATGLPYTELLDALINLALERYMMSSLRGINFKPKSEWHRK